MKEAVRSRIRAIALAAASACALVPAGLPGCKVLGQTHDAAGLTVSAGQPVAGGPTSAGAGGAASLRLDFRSRPGSRRTQAIAGDFYELRAMYTHAVVRVKSDLADYHVGVKAQPNSLTGYSLNVPPPGTRLPPGALGVQVLRYAQHPTLDDPHLPRLSDLTQTIDPVSDPGLYFVGQGVLRTPHANGFPPLVADPFGAVASLAVGSPADLGSAKLPFSATERLLNGLWTTGVSYTDASGSYPIAPVVQDRPLTDNRTLTLTRYSKWRIPFAATSFDFGGALPLGRLVLDLRVLDSSGKAAFFGATAVLLQEGLNTLPVFAFENDQGLADVTFALPPSPAPNLVPAVQEPGEFFVSTPAPGLISTPGPPVIPTSDPVSGGTPTPGPPPVVQPPPPPPPQPPPPPPPVPRRAYAGVSTLAGSGLRGLVDGVGSAARFADPVALAVDAAGKLYVADFTNNAVRIISPDGSVTTLRSSIRLSGPSGIGVDVAGNVYVGDHNSTSIIKLAPDGTATVLVRGVGNPRGTVPAPDGSVYFASDTGHFIGRIAPDGTTTLVAGGGAGSRNGTGAAAQFLNPYGIALDLGGNVIVADINNHLIRRVSPAGVVGSIGGSALATPEIRQRVGFFERPAGVAVDSLGDIYVADTFNNRIGRIRVTGQVDVIAGAIAPGLIDGATDSARFDRPFGIAVDQSGTVYVAEVGNNRIRKIE